MAEGNSSRSLLPSEPTGSDASSQNDRPTPRQPTNLQGLLRFAMEATKDEDATGPSTLQPMSDERKRFLEEAIDDLSISVTRQLREGIRVLSNEDLIRSITVESGVPSEVTANFDILEDHITFVDNAIGFYKLGGFCIFPICLSCEHPAVRSAACNLLGELCQCNPFCQAKVLECGYLKILIEMLTTEGDEDLLLRTLYGVSCIIRHHEQCTETFFNEGGLTALKIAFQKPIPHLHGKAAFLISAIYSDNMNIGDLLISSGVVAGLVAALPRSFHPCCEQIIRTLYTFVTNGNPCIIKEIRKGKEDLLEKLCENKKNFDHPDEKDWCNKIISVLRDNDNCMKSPKSQRDVCIDR